MGPYQWTPKKVTRAIKYLGLGVRSVGPVGDFLDNSLVCILLLGFNLVPTRKETVPTSYSAKYVAKHGFHITEVENPNHSINTPK